MCDAGRGPIVALFRGAMRIDGTPSAAVTQLPARQVEARRTRTSMGEIRGALARAIESTGIQANGRTLDVLAGQVSLETARGDSMYNFNFGGIKGASPRGETANYMTREVVDGRDQHLQQGFRAYTSLDEGAKDYVAVLRTRFPQAYAQALTGNVDAFAHALKQSHYFTAAESEYAAGLRAAVGAPANLAAAAAPGALEPPPALVTSAELSRVLDALASTAARIAEPAPNE